MKNDRYQDAYTTHQAKKKNQLGFSEGEKAAKIPRHAADVLHDMLSRRRSQRVFITKPIEEWKIQAVLEAARTAPSSCNRHGINMQIIGERASKEFISGFLVGGVGWCHRADRIILFLADKLAYKSPNEKNFMHYADVGFTAFPMWLMAEQLGLGVAYINPQLNKICENTFNRMYEGKIFCGALALGYFDQNRRALESEHPDIDDLIIK